MKLSPLIAGPVAAGAAVGCSSVDVPVVELPAVGSVPSSWQPASAKQTAIAATVR